jgi:hypothetical protein
MFGIEKIKAIINHNQKIIDFSVAGFPRSANTFLAIFLHRRKILSGGKLKIHSHDHSVEYLKKISDQKGCCLVPIRNPIDAVVSTYIYYNNKKTIKELSVWYFEYYSYINENIDFFLVVKFDDVVKRPNFIIKLIEKKYNIVMNSVNDIAKEKDAIFKWMDRQSREKFKRGEERHVREVGFPHEKRASFKKDAKKEVELFFKSNREPLQIYEEVICKIRNHY